MDFPGDLAHLPGAVEAASAFIGGYATASTRAAYFSDLKLWLRYCGSRRLDPLGVSRTDIEGYARGMERDGLAAATVGRRIGTIATFYRWCADEQLIGTSLLPTCAARSGLPGRNVRGCGARS